MDNIEDWVRRENIARYLRVLENGTQDGPQRAMTLKLLVEEVMLLGQTREQFVEMERQVERIKVIVARQLETIAMLATNGRPIEDAEDELYRTVDILAAHEKVRAEIKAGLPVSPRA
jgi:hypothetical protein